VVRRYFEGAPIDAALDEVAAEFAEHLAPGIPQLWAAAIESIRTDLEGWVRARNNAPAWQPVAWEHAFKDAGILHDRWHVTGTIDLIERHPEYGLRVTDHKTGRMPEAEPPQTIGRGEVLQPVLYALAAEQLYNEVVPIGQLFYATLRANYSSNAIETDRAREIVDGVFAAIDGAIHNGFLPAAPRKDACGRCDYLAICGPWEEDRTGEKPQADLAPLHRIRNTP
jgi:CRISPR/Cas system-associated exonuclease Cas4 (RecB family)